MNNKYEFLSIMKMMLNGYMCCMGMYRFCRTYFSEAFPLRFCVKTS